MQKSFIYIDTITKSQITATGTFVTKSSDYLELERGQWQILCIQFVQREEDELGVVTLTPAVLPMSDTYLFVADSDFEDDNSLMLKSFQSTLPFDETDPESNRFNIEGDWIDGSTADLSKGQMSIRINSDTEKFATVMGNRKSVTSGLYINIKQYIGGLSNPSNVAWFNFTALNTIRDWGEPEELPPQGTVVVPFISSYLKKPFEFQFSEDGVEWHDTQADSDVYYRQRIKGIDAAWGATIEMLKGERGDSFKVDAVGVLEDRALYDDEPAGFAYLATDTELVYFRVGVVSANWSEGVKLASSTQEDYTSFDVYPNSVAIAEGTVLRDLPSALIENVPEAYKDFTIYTAIPIDDTHKFTLRGYTPREQCDVVIDWGDGTRENLTDVSDDNYVLYTSEIPSTQEYGYKVSHTYTELDKKYKIKIYGRDYSSIEQNTSTASGNILCDCLGANNRVASHIYNLSSFGKYALRLLNVQAGYYRDYGKLYNYASIFTYSHNLVSVSGFALPWGNTYSCARACQNCYNLRYSDLRLPCVLTNVGAIDQVYSNCVNLTTDIARLLPSQPFMFGKNINMEQLFYACRSMTGVVPAEWFWMNQNVIFAETAKVFEKSAFVEQVPASWGGTGSDEVIPQIASLNKVVNNSSTTLVIYARANTTHVYQKPLTDLYISAVDVSVQETTIYFTAGSSITVTLPASVKTIGTMSFEPNKSYVISIKDGIAVSAEVN